ncbi:MAG: RHS repeat protein [Verrucomicrobia bacterium]|nr:RHS repeat protein [Verrucomicrobiota bacterium]
MPSARARWAAWRANCEWSYDDENRLSRVTVTNAWKTEFVYDGLGRRRVRAEYLWFNVAPAGLKGFRIC